MHVNILLLVSISKAFYRAVAEPGEAAQLCMFILGIWYLYLYLGILKCVFRYGRVVYVLVSREGRFYKDNNNDTCVTPFGRVA